MTWCIWPSVAAGDVVYVWPPAGGLLRSAKGAQTVCVCPSTSVDVAPAPSQPGIVGSVGFGGGVGLRGAGGVGFVGFVVVVGSAGLLSEPHAATRGEKTSVTVAPAAAFPAVHKNCLRFCMR